MRRSTKERGSDIINGQDNEMSPSVAALSNYIFLPVKKKRERERRRKKIKLYTSLKYILHVTHLLVHGSVTIVSQRGNKHFLSGYPSFKLRGTSPRCLVNHDGCKLQYKWHVNSIGLWRCCLTATGLAVASTKGSGPWRFLKASVSDAGCCRICLCLV